MSGGRSSDDAVERRWADRRAPSLAEIEALAWAAYERLPAAFRVHADEIAIHVTDFPEDDVLKTLGVESPYDVLGLYEGVDLTLAGVLDQPTAPTRIYLYRRPILEYWAEYDERLSDLVTHVLVHEIGHHFGLSDAQMEAIEAAADEAR